jgi:hypothetical protein
VLRDKQPDLSHTASQITLLDKWLWRRTLNKLYKGEEERVRIEIKVIEAIKNARNNAEDNAATAMVESRGVRSPP